MTADVQRELAAITDAVSGTEMYYDVAERVRTVQRLIADAEKRAAAAALRDAAATVHGWRLHESTERRDLRSVEELLRLRAVALDTSGAADEAAGR